MEHNQIPFRVEFTIEDGKIEEYKKLIQYMRQMMEDKTRYNKLSVFSE